MRIYLEEFHGSPVENSFSKITLSDFERFGIFLWDSDSLHRGFKKGVLRPILDAVLCWGVPERFLQHGSDRRIKPFFRGDRTSRAERLWKACCTPQHGFSTASKMKRRSLDVIFLYKLEKFEKYFPVNWGIIIEYIPKHYIK